MDEVPLKKRKINLAADDDNEFPKTENINRKKCAKLDSGLAIKYNKLVYNFESIVKFNLFRKYCVFYDVFSKRHLINHNFRIDLLQILNCYDFSSYAYQQCHCGTGSSKMTMMPVVTDFLVCFKNQFMERKKYCNRQTKSEKMERLYEKHSILYEDNYFYDNRINECFLMKIKQFERLDPPTQMPIKTLNLLQRNMYRKVPNIDSCLQCRNMQLATSRWRMIRFRNCINMKNLCDHVLKLDNVFLVPNYPLNKLDASTKIIVYKTSHSNLLFLYNDVFYVLNSSNVLVVFPVDIFKNVTFFCNFNFYFVKESHVHMDNNFININNN